MQNRGAHRLPLHAEALLHLSLPEDTASLRTFRAVALNLSAEGVCLQSYQVDAKLAAAVERQAFSADAELDLPYLQRTLRVTGVIAWVRYEPPTEREPGHTLLGVRFDSMSAEVKQKLLYVLARLSGDSFSSGDSHRIPPDLHRRPPTRF